MYICMHCYGSQMLTHRGLMHHLYPSVENKRFLFHSSKRYCKIIRDLATPLQHLWDDIYLNRSWFFFTVRPLKYCQLYHQKEKFSIFFLSAVLQLEENICTKSSFKEDNSRAKLIDGVWCYLSACCNIFSLVCNHISCCLQLSHLLALQRNCGARKNHAGTPTLGPFRKWCYYHW